MVFSRKPPAIRWEQVDNCTGGQASCRYEVVLNFNVHHHCSSRRQLWLVFKTRFNDLPNIITVRRVIEGEEDWRD